MDRTVLFTGGPLHGKSWVVPGSQMSVQYHDPGSPALIYNLARFMFCGHVIWIGYLGDKPDDDRAFDVLASDAAKAATYISVVTAY